MLEVSDLHAFYGKSHVLQGVGFSVGRGEIVSLLGRNGAGRSTTVKAIMGLVIAHGKVRFKGQDILGLQAHEVARRRTCSGSSLGCRPAQTPRAACSRAASSRC